MTGGFPSFSLATFSIKFGSSDNIAALKDADETQGDEGVGPGGMRTLRTGQLYGRDDDGSAGGPPRSRDNTPDHAQTSGFDAILREIQELRENQGRLEECFKNVKAYHQQEYTVIVEALQEERYRCERLEQQLNDLTELHQNEILNLKEELANMEEGIAYQSYERVRGIQEALEACQTRLFKMEQHQQVVQREGVENATARTLLGKLLQVLLAVMAVLLGSVSTVANCVMPLMKTCSRTLFMLLFVVLSSFLWRHWDATSTYLHDLFCTRHPEKGDQ